MESKKPTIENARICTKQQNYDLAAEIYSEILSNTNTETPSIYLCILYIEYSDVLIHGANNFFVKYLNNMINYKIYHSKENIERVDDLEIAWNCLEITKNMLRTLKTTMNEDDKKWLEGSSIEILLQKTYFLLGEIQLLDNKFNGAISDYSESLKYYPDNGLIHQRIAQCYEFLKDNENAILYHQKSIPFYENDKNIVLEILEKIEYLRNEESASNIPEDENNEVIEEQNGNVIDLNACKKKKN